MMQRIEWGWRWRLAVLLLTLASVSGEAVLAEETGDGPRHPEKVKRFLEGLYDEEDRAFRFREDYPGGFGGWRKAARSELRRLVGLDRIESQVGGHLGRVRLAAAEDLGKFTRAKGFIETEPGVEIPFWLLRPKGVGPFPLAVLPHGHSSTGHDTHAGVFHDAAQEAKAVSEDRDVAVQAVKRGFLAIAPATRGLAVDGVPDVYGRHDDRDCRSQLMHCLLVNRTAIGERVWDLGRILDWAVRRDDVDAKHVLMMGNSGGGMATLYTAALDERITVAVPSCSFTTVVSPDGKIYHCDCNMVPGILEWGDLYDAAGLVAPRYLLAVNGRQDKLHDVSSMERAARRAGVIFKAAGCPERFEHRLGAEGHRFYSDLMWPFVMDAIGKR